MEVSLLQCLKGHTENVWAIDWSPDGQLLASCGKDRQIRLWKYDQIQQSFVLYDLLEGVHNKTVRSIKFSPNGSFLATASFDSTICIYKFMGGKFQLIQQLEGHESEVKAVDWNNTSKYLVSCSRDKSVWVWDYYGNEIEEFECNNVLTGHTEDIKYVKWSSKQNEFFSASYDNQILHWELEDDDYINSESLTGHLSTVWCLDISNDGTELCSVSDDKTIKFWKIQQLQSTLCTQTLQDYHTEPIYTCSYNQTSDLLITGGGDNKINIFRKNPQNLNNFQFELNIENAHNPDVNCVKCHPCDPYIFASCGDDQIVKIWKIQNKF